MHADQVAKRITELGDAFNSKSFALAGAVCGVVLGMMVALAAKPPLWVAAMSEAGALRAARVGANLLPQGPRAPSLDTWAATLRADGRDPASYRIGIIRSCLVTDDRERDRMRGFG